MNDATMTIFVGGIISALILYFVIRFSTLADKRQKSQMAVLLMLGKIAEKNGVDPNEIQAIVDAVK